MANPESYGSMSDEQFEEVMNDYVPNDSQETPSESLGDSTEVLDETPVDGAESPVEASEEVPEEFEVENTDTEEEVHETPEQEEEDPIDEAEESPEDDSPEPEPQELPEELKELYAPFKASGKEVSVKSVEEAKKLMSMGVDYASKLQGFKVHRKTIKTLEQNKIDAEKLNLLIDASNGNADAINKLIQDNKIDVMELDKEGNDYTPNDHSVSDSQVELDDVLDRIQSTAAFSTTSDIVTNQWDADSKKEILNSPRNLELLNEQVSNGTYERITKEVTRARLFGGLQNLTDLQAYETVGKQMAQSGAFNQEASKPEVISSKPVTKAKTTSDKKLRASQSKGNPPKTKEIKYDFINMSDEDFEKHLKR